MDDVENNSDLTTFQFDSMDVENNSHLNVGFGQKYLAKCGYRGGGLGVNEQGIVAPIEAKLRPKNMGLGFNKHIQQSFNKSESHQKTNLPFFTQPLDHSDQSVSNYLSKQTGKDKKRKHYIKPEEELLVNSKSQESRRLVPRIIDMTRPDVRVVTDLKNLNKLDEDKKSVRVFEDEKVSRINEAERDNQQYFDNVEEIMRVLGRIDEKKNSEKLSLEFLYIRFMDLQTRYVEEYNLLDLSTVVCSYAVPLFTKMFQGWDMLQFPTHGIDNLRIWNNRMLLGNDSYLYTQLVMDVVYPAVRVTCTNNWHVRDPEPMLKFLETWHELLPTYVMHMILENIVLPKLLAAVMSWDPINEVVPIDFWIHPWLPLLGDKLEESCYPTIRDGFASMLRVWEPTDMSAYYALSPWKSVFGSATWEELIVRYVVPKLMSFMDDLQINRVEHKLDQFHWASVIPNHHLLQIMDLFFNKWQEVLNQWLRDNPEFEVVRRWFLGWKEELPPELEANEYIQYRLTIGLKMMDMAVEGLEVAPPSIQKNIDHLRKRKRKCVAVINEIRAEYVSGGPEMSLKEAVEIYAQQNDLLFTPKFGRTKDGLQIYGFGNISVVIDSLNQKVLARVENGSSQWSTVSLTQLLKLHHHAGSARQ